jgi:biotin carboxyl carrier protein
MMMHILNRTRLIFSALTGISCLFISCHNTTPAAEETTIVKTPVTITSAEFKPVTSSVTLPATATFLNKSIIRATTAGTVDRILITTGEHISPGQLLFTIKTKEAMAAGKAIDSDSSLFFKGLINILSHKEGVINSIGYQKGDFVQEGDELAVLSEQNSLVFILEVPFELEKYIAMNINCSIVLPDNRQLMGTITGKLPEMDIQSQTVKYVIKPVSDYKLPANLIASINLIKSVNKRASVLPKAAVLGDETQTSFWVMKLINDSTAIRVPVIKGFENNDIVEITDPVFLPDDKVLLTGNYGLPDTARVTIIKK